MLQQARLHRIQALLSTLKQVSTEQIMKELAVSRETVRRDIIELEAKHLVKRVHGGIVSLDFPYQEPPLQVRQSARAKEKQAIARRCIQLLRSGQTLFIDSGSTTAKLAEELRSMSGLTIITNSLQVAFNLNQEDEQVSLKNEIILLGGSIQANAKETRGEATINAIDRYRADIALLSPVGINEEGASSYHSWESAIAEAMIRQSRQHIMLADHSKIGLVSRFVYAKPEQMNSIITDHQAARHESLSMLEKTGTEIILA
ncbi:MAG: HTH-type transcriptional repressor GlcR [Candidatus Celerinatantimonas neptuna]|nr:MAG: HTH-type transcriptional repressor GlcR [Candidatus Celerinatantimonas neptuna]